MKILILGARGQLGSEFSLRLPDAVALGRDECDVTDFDSVLDVFSSVKPGIVINCSAYNLVDRAEDEFWKAYAVNAVGAKNVACACRRFKAFMVHFSTDYVFDGEKEGLYVETDRANPVNEYGKSKFAGERFVEGEIEDRLIFRVSWVYGRGKRNFVYKLIQWSENTETVRVSYDEFSIPTSTSVIVDATLKALDLGLIGLYHLTCSGVASRYEWAKKVFQVLRIKKALVPVPSSVFNLAAERPRFSAMSNNKLSKDLSLELPYWEDELNRFLRFAQLF